MLGVSPAMELVRKEVEAVAPTEFPVLILGETGVGKELAARAIHDGSRRREAPLIHVNCAALPEGVIESELFGHVRGAFTGAIANRAGKFELADGGTLLWTSRRAPLGAQASSALPARGQVQRVGRRQADPGTADRTDDEAPRSRAGGPSGRLPGRPHHRSTCSPADPTTCASAAATSRF